MSKDTSSTDRGPLSAAVDRGGSEALGTSRASTVGLDRCESRNDDVWVLGASTRVSAKGNTVKFSNAVTEINGERLIEPPPETQER